jgi:ABC-2 type transport system ATP-binding protein
LVVAAFVLVAACREQVTGPPVAMRVASAKATSADQGPPTPRQFGSDSYSTGSFTGGGITAPGLSCSSSVSGVRECDGFLASTVDGTLLDVRVQIPATTPKPVPLVAVVHGYGGSKTSSGDIANALLAEGYAVLRYSTRGFGDSWGQVNLVDVHAEVADLRAIIGRVLDWNNDDLDFGRVAVTGASYGGGHSWLAALQPTFTSPDGNTVHIRTVVPIAAWSDLLYSLVPNGRERDSIDAPGGAKMSFINGLYLSGWRLGKNPKRPYDNYPEYYKGWYAWLNAMEPNDIDPIFRSAADGAAGYRSVWWQEAFWSTATTNRLPIFVVQGFTDDLFPLPEAKRMLLALKTLDPTYPIAAYFGDIGHPRAANKPGEVEYVLALIKSWLAYYLKGIAPPPPNVIYAAITRPRGQAFSAGDVLTVPTLDALSNATASKQFVLATPTVLVNPATEPVTGPFWDPLVMTGAQTLPYFPDQPPLPEPVAGSLGTYEVPVSELGAGSTLTIAGQPTVTLHATISAPRVQLNVRLFEVDAAGKKQLVTRGTYTVQMLPPALPIDLDIVIPTYGNLWQAPADHTLRLELTNVDAPYITPSRVPSTTVVTSVRLDLPVRK